jgi:tetratricopeptide (TPR) repeat protein
MSRRYKEAAALFDALLQNDGDNALFMRSAGVCRAYLGDYARAKAIADKLRSLGENDDMSESDIAELYYLCGEYAAHNAIYDKSRFNYDLDEDGYIAPYLYSLKITGETGAIERKYEEIVQKINDDITQAKAPPENEQKRFVKKSRKRLRGVEKLYAAIVNDDFNPQVKIRPYFIENCYLIDCPRHQTAILT